MSEMTTEQEQESLQQIEERVLKRSADPTAWVDITEEVNAAAQARAADPDLQSIELDCPPGHPRPGDLIAGVLAGTGLEGHIPPTTLKFMGHWTWEWRMPRAQWEAFVQPIVAPRIKKLYARGVIRFGSW